MAGRNSAGVTAIRYVVGHAEDMVRELGCLLS